MDVLRKAFLRVEECSYVTSGTSHTNSKKVVHCIKMSAYLDVVRHMAARTSESTRRKSPTC